MKQIGVCLSSCPSGYYGTRYPDINKCASKCWIRGSTQLCLFPFECCVSLGDRTTEKQTDRLNLILFSSFIVAQ